MGNEILSFEERYEHYIRKINVSVRQGNGDELYTQTLFFKEIHELESSAARNTVLLARILRFALISIAMWSHIHLFFGILNEIYLLPLMS